MTKVSKFLVCLIASCVLFGCGKASDNPSPSVAEEPSGTVEETAPSESVDVVEDVASEPASAEEAPTQDADIAPAEETLTQEADTEAAEDVPVQDTVEEVPVTTDFSGKVIVIDAGHGKNSSKKQEAIAPTSATTKPAFVSGTSGKTQTEEELNLAVALKLQAALEGMGATVHMTRTTHETDLSNIGRAEFANNLNADISVKLHADGSTNSSARGISVLIPGGDYIKDSDMLSKSKAAGNYILSELISATGASNKGISVRNDMTGFNWSTVPVVLIEMGFMTNAEEDALLATDEYQNKIVSGIVSGLTEYFK